MSYKHALVVGKFAPLHKGHQFLVECARSEAARITVLCYATPDFTAMPSAVRAMWIEDLYPDVQVLVPDGAPPDSAPGPLHWAFLRQWLVQAGVDADVVFSSEEYGPPFASALGLAHRMVDPARSRVPISATAIRDDVHGQRALLAPGVYRHFVQRIALVGAESTGKSTLAAFLAGRCGTRFMPEVGREMWAARQGKLFLCGDEIPFHQDGWRDDAAWRSRIQGMVRYDLQVRGIGDTELHGTLEQRAVQLLSCLEEEGSCGNRSWSERAG